MIRAASKPPIFLYVNGVESRLPGLAATILYCRSGSPDTSVLDPESRNAITHRSVVSVFREL
jgi:hypothetical protein